MLSLLSPTGIQYVNEFGDIFFISSISYFAVLSTKSLLIVNLKKCSFTFCVIASIALIFIRLSLGSALLESFIDNAKTTSLYAGNRLKSISIVAFVSNVILMPLSTKYSIIE